MEKRQATAPIILPYYQLEQENYDGTRVLLLLEMVLF